MKKKLLIIIAVIVVAFAVGGVHFWYSYFAVHTIKYDPQLTIYWGGMAGNSLVLVSEDGSKALVIDTKAEGDAKDLRKNVIAKDVIIVNTHSHYDHTMGNFLYPEATIIGGAYSKEQWAADSKQSRYPDQTITPQSGKVIKIGSETVQIYNTGRAHTLNDMIVYLEKRQLLFVGDLVFVGIHPPLFSQSGAHVGSWIKVLEMLPEKYTIKTVIPGHGTISDKNIIKEMRDYFIQIRDAVNDSEKLENLKKKYDHYFSVPNMSGFDYTVNFIKNEQKTQ
jgi:cyclase